MFVASITVPTRNLLGLLTDAILTAGCDPEYPLLRTVLLDTARGDITLDPGSDREDALIEAVPSDLLVATSTDGLGMIGQVHTACTGQWHHPVLVSATDAKVITDAFKDKDVATQLTLEIIGGQLEVAEDEQLVPGGLSVSCPIVDHDDYPTSIPVLMQPDPFVAVVDGHGQVIDPSYGTGVPGWVFDIVGKVSKRRKMPVAWYRHHQDRGIVVEVGSMWRGLFKPVLLEDGAELGPVVRVFEPRLPVREPSASLPV